ncbi:aminodeoxychorismate/anthranilate synthase component II [Listeria booriae]|uniref:Anthranilate synthase subunit II n=1 Tax=Listeria booriae TaxID=1552123 RepID=A0A099W1R6_9LIST|nr:aminodeoxychorismate/anthranilate synthase component II [Listeria booriae]KGL38353.1 anthranilate synthase subunit II [Listeria booriae]MBC1913243.1 aminodeoxychorismate/anthranilate synthase component II [Listeria booriae]STY46090.1 Para-aminobenzoate synthase glutamine amidotransferase component II [Listeria booriae]
MILLVDNYDSFTYNLEQYLMEYASEVVVRRNDAADLMEVAERATGIVLSPGPGKPSEAGLLEEVVRVFANQKPMLGICLGHQAIGEVFGGTVSQAEKIRHGKVSMMKQSGGAIFAGLGEELEIMRYHSLIVEQADFPEDLEVLARSLDDDEIMAMQLRDYPVYGLQFHPESIGTLDGKQMMANFVAIVEKEGKHDGSIFAKSI